MDIELTHFIIILNTISNWVS